MFPPSRPQSLDEAMEAAYAYLIRALEPMCGYPLQFQTGPPAEFGPDASPRRDSDGSLHYPLAAPGHRRTRWYLLLPAEAAADRSCKRIASRFTALSDRIARQVKEPSDIREYLIRNTPFVWDEMVVSLTHPGAQRYNTILLIRALRESLLFRYEDKPVRLGALMTWNWHSTGRALREIGCSMLTMSRQEGIQATLRESKALNLLVDGENSLLLVTPEGTIAGWVSIAAIRGEEANADWEMVPKRYHHLARLLIGRDVVCTTTESGELYLFRKASVMRWTTQGWIRVTGLNLRRTLLSHVPEAAAAVLSDVAVELSFQKRGGLIAIVPDPAEISTQASPGLASFFREDPLLMATEAEFQSILRLASLDGCVLVDSSGAVRNAAVILNVPGGHTSAGEGARDAAASYASTHGVAIKISQDGPISVYRNGKLARLA